MVYIIIIIYYNNNKHMMMIDTSSINSCTHSLIIDHDSIATTRMHIYTLNVHINSIISTTKLVQQDGHHQFTTHHLPTTTGWLYPQLNNCSIYHTTINIILQYLPSGTRSLSSWSRTILEYYIIVFCVVLSWQEKKKLTKEDLTEMENKWMVIW